MKLKKIIIIAGIIGIIALVGFNVYYFGYLQMRKSAYQKGLNDGAVNLANQLRSGIRVNYEDGVIMFVPKQ